MKLNDEQMRALWQADEPPHSSSCLSEKQLLRAGQQALSASEQAATLAHLATCPACVEAYRIARSAYEWANETAALVKPAPVAPTVLAPVAKGWHGNHSSWWRWASACAAALLLAFVGLSIWTYRLWLQNQTWQARANQQQVELAQVPTLQAQLNELQKQHAQTNQALTDENNRLQSTIAKLTQPQIEAPIIDLDPASLARGAGQPASTRIEVPPTTEWFTVIFHLNQEPYAKKLLLEWRDIQHNRVLWQREIVKGNAPNVTLTLSRQNVPPGKYRVRLTALQLQRRKVFEQYELEIVYRH